MNIPVLFSKAERVIRSCQNLEQLAVASKYVGLLNRNNPQASNELLVLLLSKENQLQVKN